MAKLLKAMNARRRCGGANACPCWLSRRNHHRCYLDSVALLFLLPVNSGDEVPYQK